MMKRLALITLTIGATLLGMALLWQFRPALELFGGSLALSAALRPLVKRLEDRGVGRGLAILMWYLAILALLAGFIFVYGVGVGNDLSQAAAVLPRYYNELRASWQSGTPVQQAIARGLPEFGDLMRNGASDEQIAAFGGTALGILSGLLGGIIFLLAMLSLAFYWLTEVTHFERLWLSVLPVTTRVRARQVWRNTEGAVGSYVRSTVFAITMAGLLLLMLFSAIGQISNGMVAALPFAALLALIGGLSHLVPRIGPTISLLLATGVAATVSPVEAVIVLVGGGAIQYATHRLTSRMSNSEIGRINPLLQVLLLLALGELGGLSAMLFAPPLAALVQVLYFNLRDATVMGRTNTETAMEMLLDRLARLRSESDADNKEFANALSRSDDLLQQARKMMDSPS